VLLEVPFGLSLVLAGVLLARADASAPARNRDDTLSVQGA
jgi:hypothetical protein